MKKPLNVEVSVSANDEDVSHKKFLEDVFLFLDHFEDPLDEEIE